MQLVLLIAAPLNNIWVEMILFIKKIKRAIDSFISSNMLPCQWIHRVRLCDFNSAQEQQTVISIWDTLASLWLLNGSYSPVCSSFLCCEDSVELQWWSHRRYHLLTLLPPIRERAWVQIQLGVFLGGSFCVVSVMTFVHHLMNKNTLCHLCLERAETLPLTCKKSVCGYLEQG